MKYLEEHSYGNEDNHIFQQERFSWQSIVLISVRLADCWSKSNETLKHAILDLVASRSKLDVL